MLKAILNQGLQIWLRRFVVLTLLLVLAFVAMFFWRSWINHKKEQCIVALERAGAEVQYGVASEKYYVSFYDKQTLNDIQLKAAMPYIKRLEPLECLNLCDTTISDRSVDLLVQCDVAALHIKRTKITAKGAAELRHKLPNTWISHESLGIP